MGVIPNDDDKFVLLYREVPHKGTCLYKSGFVLQALHLCKDR